MNYCTVSFDKKFLEKVKAMKQNKLNVDLTNSYYNDNDIVDEHDAEPIKSKDDINRICMYLLKEKRYRDYCLFIIVFTSFLFTSPITTTKGLFSIIFCL